MIDKITQTLTNKIKKEMPEIDEERAEIINYGLQILLGEVPKVFIMLGIAYLLGVFKLSLITFLILMPYRGASGGFHLRTHIGCIVSTCTFYCGVSLLAKNIILDDIAKYFLVIFVNIFGIIMIKLYAPADTEDVPIISKKVRMQKQVLSYIFLVIGLIIASIIKNNIISNIIIFGYIAQTFMITRLAYRMTNSKYGYEVYENASNQI
ncbi:MAG: accessory gene regulator B family protein [Clostridia bacterium]|jgi:accessory gene regulator B|nr:accessory gene regulator B family protein [Clostridia bacterium]